MLAYYCLIKVVRRTSVASSDVKPSQRHISVHLESCLCRPDGVKLNTHSAFSSLLVSTSFSGKCLSLLNPSLFSLVSSLRLFNSGPAANSSCLYFSFLPAGFGHKVYESMKKSHSVRVDITAALTTEQCIMHHPPSLCYIVINCTANILFPNILNKSIFRIASNSSKTS